MTDYNRIAEKWDATRRSAWGEFEFFRAPFFSSARAKQKVRVFDAGCGNGRLVNFLDACKLPYEYLGGDASSELIKRAQKNFPERKFEEWNLARSLDSAQPRRRSAAADDVSPPEEEVRSRKDFSRRKFDVIFCIAVLHHFSTRAEQITVLKNLHRALVPGGRLFLTTWNLFQPRYLKNVLRSLIEPAEGAVPEPRPRSPRGINCVVPFDHQIERVIHVFTRAELTELLAEAGFRDVEIFYAAHAEKTDAVRGRNLVTIAKT